jgi:hypothetical protein
MVVGREESDQQGRKSNEHHDGVDQLCISHISARLFTRHLYTQIGMVSRKASIKVESSASIDDLETMQQQRRPSRMPQLIVPSLAIPGASLFSDGLLENSTVTPRWNSQAAHAVNHDIEDVVHHPGLAGITKVSPGCPALMDDRDSTSINPHANHG